MTNNNASTHATTHDNFTISSQQTLLPLHQQLSQTPSPPTKPPLTKYRKRIFISSLILLILVVCSIALYFIHKNKTREDPNTYLARSKNYYCHVTKYPDLCRESMSSVLNATAVQSNPNLFFPASIRIAVNQLNEAAFTIDKALSATATQNSSMVRQCEKLVHRSLSQLNESVDLAVEWLSYSEIFDVKAVALTAVNGTSDCLSGLEWVGSGVEEVRVGVERAKKCLINSVGLMNRRDYIFSDFYRIEWEWDEGYYFDSYSYHPLSYGFLACMYGALYLFVALLFLLFWRTPVNYLRSDLENTNRA